MWTPPTLESDRLILRAVTQADAADIYDYARLPEVALYTMWQAHQNLEDSLGFITQYVFPMYQKEVPEPFGMVEKKTGKFIGTVGCFKVKEHSMELAYALSPKYWGQGLMVEAAKVVVDYCFKKYQLERIQCRCKAPNIASERVMQKLGMRYEGTLRNEIFHRDQYWDMKYYSLLKEELR